MTSFLQRVPLLVLALIMAMATNLASAQLELRILPNEQMRINLSSSFIQDNGSEYYTEIFLELENGDPGAPTSFRQWWHCEIAGLNPALEKPIRVRLRDIATSDYITPVWSLDGGTVYTRVPPSRFQSINNTLEFRITPPLGTSSLRLAKYFPYSPAKLDAYLDTVLPNVSATIENIGTSVQGRPIKMLTITNFSVPNTNKERVWIHSAVHPAENTCYFLCEGLISWLLGGSPEAQACLDNLIITIVPMANPDGVAVGNYRTNANTVNLEMQWSSPYNSTEPEIVALRTKIEEFMGTSVSPGANPIKVLLNLHATHGSQLPYHFIHAPNWPTNGVTSAVRTLENQWVAALRGRTSYIRSTDSTSTLTPRAYVESMMHDRYSTQPQWDNVMAITYEGVYDGGPIPGVPNTDDDYRDVGIAHGLALFDYFGLEIDEGPPTSIDDWMLMCDNF